MSKKTLQHPCHICGTKTFNSKFCSNQCTAVHNKVRLTGMVSKVKGIERLPREIRLCKICKTPMRVKLNSVKKYCSRKCQWSGQGLNNIGKAWGNGIKGVQNKERVQIKCSVKDCDNLISVRPLMAKQLAEEKRNHYCSQKCYLAELSKRTSGTRNPMAGRKRIPSEITMEKFKRRGNFKTKIGFREDLGHLVRSSWEADFARLWKYLGATYEYEKHRFDLDELGTYCPDFYLPAKDHYYEIKGQMDEVFIENRLKKMYEKYHIKIIMISHANFLWVLVWIRENLPYLFETLENKHLVKHYNWTRVHALQDKEYNKIEDELTKANSPFIEPHILKQLQLEEPKFSLATYEN